jgi:hypothetical protein
LRERILSRPEHVEETQAHSLEPVNSRKGAAVLLSGELRDAVRRDRKGLIVLCLGEDVVCAIDGRGGCEHDAPHALIAGREQDVQRSFDVYGSGGQRILDRTRHRRQGTEVENDVGVANRRVGALIRAQITFDEADVEPFEAFSSPRREVVEHANLATIGKKPTDEVMTNEAATSGDEGTLRPSVALHG